MPVYQPTATQLVNGDVVVAGGELPPNKITKDVAIFDWVHARWSATSSLTISREYNTATTLQDGRVLVAGGTTKGRDPASPENLVVVASAELGTIQGQ